MAGDWIKWCKGLTRKREVIVLASLLRRDRHEIAGRLMVLWEWCDDNAAEGDFDEHGNLSLIIGDSPFAFVDETVGLPGFADALASPEVCWLSARSGGRLAFPNLARHNGSTAKARAYEARKKQLQRGKLSPKHGDKTGTREEKRREEKEIPKGISRVTAADVLIPPALDGPETREAVKDWLAYKASRGESYKRPEHLQRKLSEFSSAVELIASVNASIGNNYAGLFPAKSAPLAKNGKNYEL